MLVVYVPLAVVSYRLGTSLPAVALDEGGPFMAGWDATRGENGTIAVLALVTVLIVFGSSVIGLYVLIGITPLFVAWNIVFNWLAMMVGVSVLTTLYGHFIEKRALV